MTQAAPPILDDAPGRGRSLARHYPRGLHIEPHSHTWAQVLYAVSGVMWVEAGSEALVVPPQRAVWLPPGTTHAIHMMSEVEMRNLYLHERDIGPLSTRSEVFQIDGLLRELIRTIAEHEAERDDAWLATASQLAAMELAHARRSSLRVPLPDAAGTTGSGDRRLAMLCRAVIDDPSNEIAFEQHAASVGASVRTLARLFTRELGLGFAQWRRQVQLAIAVSRLAEGQSVSAVARQLGYLPSSFSDMFRRELGVAPSEYRPVETLGQIHADNGAML
ncbi:AraC family transcriptional regulator [Paraburkholderia eburnea]|uniref:AraC family transcriptional regulator n=1 Tax=Paraburkholderia eburnea TaxID=1189126 RepID=A0A2S4LT47_9BURK|nr:helix-turn-helix transcriptional regulator [Paraburkholderia eburnea]POR45627.1 AraC family transcriptional regulator [Paraburkholderia eburnea]PRZ14131.1 AraC family transcriptional regulator [Paraburkholderia eburnea]